MATKHQLHRSLTNATKKKKTHKSPLVTFFQELNSVSKTKDLNAAISLYDSAVSSNIHLNQQHFNTLLYLCSMASTDPGTKDLALSHGFRIFDHMLSSRIPPSEASFTAAARLAPAKGDGDYAFELVKKMGDYGLTPRLRSYEPALLFFCVNLEAEKAYGVEEHMGLLGVSLEEAELVALLKVSVETGREGRVYSYLHKLRVALGCVSEDTTKVIEGWFRGKGSGTGGLVNYDEGLVKEAILKNGGGWHGLGWIGEGKWVLRRECLEECGRCCSCGELLSCVDVGDVDTEKFAQSLAGLAFEREAHANFREFQVKVHSFRYFIQFILFNLDNGTPQLSLPFDLFVPKYLKHFFEHLIYD